MSDSFVGKFKLVSSDNFDNYMKKVGVGFALRTLANSSSPVVDISHEGDKWTMITTTTFKTVRLDFTPGVEFEETTPDGRVVKAVVNFDDGKMVHKQTGIKSGEKNSEIIRWIENDQLITTVTCEDVSSKRIYKKE